MSSTISMLNGVNNTLIDIKDFAKYHKYVLSDSDPLMVYKVKKLANERYDVFHHDILSHYADKDGKILCGRAAMLWLVYEDAKEILSTYDNLTTVRVVDREQADFWLNEFKKPIEELYLYGANLISSGYGIVVDYFREYIVREKFERIYSKAKTFDGWVALAEANFTLLSGEDLPFNIKPIDEKVKVLLKVRH